MSAITNLAQQLKTECNVEALARELAEKYNFQIRSHLLEFQGLCQACRQ